MKNCMKKPFLEGTCETDMDKSTYEKNFRSKARITEHPNICGATENFVIIIALPNYFKRVFLLWLQKMHFRE